MQTMASTRCVVFCSRFVFLFLELHLVLFSLLTKDVAADNATIKQIQEYCNNVIQLDEKWRSVQNNFDPNNPRCDEKLLIDQSYTFGSTNNTNIPTQCIKNHVCGAKVAMWLDINPINLPDSESILQAHLYGAYDVLGKYDCYVLRTPVIVVSCNGRYVYRLLKPIDRCPVAICTQDINEKISDETKVKHGESVNQTTESSTSASTVTEEVTSDLPTSDVQQTSVTASESPSQEPTSDVTARQSDNSTTEAISTNDITFTVETESTDVVTTSAESTDVVTTSAESTGTETTSDIETIETSTQSGVSLHDPTSIESTSDETPTSTTESVESSTSASSPGFLSSTTGDETSTAITMETSDTTDKMETVSTEDSSPPQEIAMPQSTTTEASTGPSELQSDEESSVSTDQTQEDTGTTLNIGENTGTTLAVGEDTSTTLAVGEDTSTTLAVVEDTSTTLSVVEDTSTTLVVGEDTGATLAFVEDTTTSLAVASTSEEISSHVEKSSPSLDDEAHSSSTHASPVAFSKEALTDSTTDSTTETTKQAEISSSSRGLEESSAEADQEDAETTPRVTPEVAVATTTITTSTQQATSMMTALSTTTTWTHDVIVTETVMMIFRGALNNATHHVGELLTSFLRRALNDSEHRHIKALYELLSNVEVNVSCHSVNKTCIKVTIKSSGREGIIAVFDRLDIKKYFLEHAKYELLEYCIASEKNCGSKSADATVGASKTTFEKNAPIFITVITLCVVCLVVIVIGAFCTKVWKRGTYHAGENVERAGLAENRQSIAANPSPFTDEQIMKGEVVNNMPDTVDKGSSNGSALDGGENSTWVIPLDDAPMPEVSPHSCEDTKL